MSKPYLLYLGNGRKMESLAKLGERFESWDVTVDRHWAYNGEFPDSLDGYDGIFLSGSPHGAYVLLILGTQEFYLNLTMPVPLSVNLTPGLQDSLNTFSVIT